jgi:PAS domain S-box-containing protein
MNIRQKITIISIIGFLIGLIFPITAISISILSNNLSFTFDQLIELHQKHIYFWLLEVIPFVSILLAFFISRNFFLKIDGFKEIIDNESAKTQKIYEFTEKIRKGEIDADYELFDKHDDLGKSLINLRNELKRRDEDERKRRREDDQRHWATEGIAEFSGLLRENNDDLEKLAYEIISNLVKYVGAVIGGFFILEEEEKDIEKIRYFKLYAAYAYDRQKYSNRRVEWGEGLIGACALEQEKIFITKVTKNYVNITSGLGKSNPRCVLLVPLKINDEVFGVVELASFKVLEKYQIEFIEKLAESIASTISSFKINDRTAKLLKESQEQAKKMAQQEDLLRKNLEELKLTQSEAAQQSEEFVSFNNSVNHTLIRAEYNIDGTLIYANTKFLHKLGYVMSAEISGKHISMFINEKDLIWFDKIWSNLAKGGHHFENYMKYVTKDGKDLWTMATYTCVRDPKGNVIKILFLAIDTTEQKKLSLDYEGQIKALNNSSIKAEYSPAGTLIECNQKYLDTLGFESLNKIKGSSIFDTIRESKGKQINITWTNVINGIPFEGQIKTWNNNREERWLQATLSAVDDMYGDISKIIMIANDITEQKNMEIKTRQQAELLKNQEEELQQSEIDLSKKLEEAKEEMKRQFKKIEIVKMLNEKTLEGLLDCVISINRQGEIEFFNKAAEEFWGVSREELLGQLISKLFPPEFGETDVNYIGNFFVPGAKDMIGKRMEVNIIKNDREKIPVMLTISEARIGKEYRLTAFVQNIEVEFF